MLSPKLLEEVESFIKENPKLGYTAKEEFTKDAVRFKLTCSSEEKPSGHSKMQ
jgi:hypothetical protein